MLLVGSETAIKLASTDNPVGWACVLGSQGGAEAFVDVVFGIADADNLRVRHLGGDLASALVTQDPAVAFLVLDGNFGMFLHAFVIRITSPRIGVDGAQTQPLGCESDLSMRTKADPA